ncbi:SIR2 family protein [Planctomycetota bacterium]
MSSTSDFHRRLERKVRQQLSGQKVGYLLGAGSSYLAGAGYPLASHLWPAIRKSMDAALCREIQERLDEGADGLENALDLLDPGRVDELPHRHAVTSAIAALFEQLEPPSDNHAAFLQRLSRRTDFSVPVFCLNYDPLLERASEQARVRLVDGYAGFENAYFAPEIFQFKMGAELRGSRYRQGGWVRGIVHLYKLHGSLGWFCSQDKGAIRRPFRGNAPPNSIRLMVPPQHRKAADTTAPPYSDLWSEFRRLVRHGPFPLNRLASIGYGMRDEHVNAVLENGLARHNFTLMIFTRSLTDAAFERWSARPQVIVVTRRRCSMYEEVGEGHPDLWSFERLSHEV